MLRVAQRYFLGEPTMAEDAVQNAWLRVVEKFSRLQDIPRKKRGAYLVVIAKNESISLLRKRHQELPFDDTIVADKGDFESDNAKDIIETIQKMPETYRAVIEMRFVEELSTKEIAVALGLKETTVNVRIHRGRALLMKKLREEGYVK
jgi:RNA polymerase sigma-70 factor (ECF subfamily)